MSRVIMNVELYTVPEVAAKLQIDKRAVYRMIRERELPARRIGRPYLVSAPALSKFLETAR